MNPAPIEVLLVFLVIVGLFFLLPYVILMLADTVIEGCRRLKLWLSKKLAPRHS
ncbi:MAG: hypothetical protein RLY93_19990 [Sumerlaeia bacterium]